MWNTVNYATPGRSHIKTGIPCQDKVASYQDDYVTVTALADGAGCARLSHYGADAVSHAICLELGAHIHWYLEQPDASLVRERLQNVILTQLETTKAECGCEASDLSSTLLAVAVTADSYFILHIGDGVIGYRKDGQLKVATHPDNGGFANETIFTTSRGAFSKMRIMKGDVSGISGFVLMSDGTEAALYNKRSGKLSAGIERIMQMTALTSQMTMRRLLDESFRDIVNVVTADDCSISVLVNRKAFPAFAQMTAGDKADLMGMDLTADGIKRQLRQTDAILTATIRGATLRQLARQIHVKERYVKKKADRLAVLGLLECDQGVYTSYAGRYL